MRRREFTKTILAGSVALSSGLTSCKNKEIPSIKSTQLPSNWVWLRPNLDWDLDQWKQSFDDIKVMGIDAVVPQVYNSHNALFDHPIVPVKDNWLERILPIAHAAGLEVHAWMWSMPLNVPALIEKHPDWFSVNRKGNPSHTHPAYVDYYKFMDPCHPEVQEFVAGNVEALAKIEDLDGVHLDYIRQPDVILAEALQPKYNIVQDKEYAQYDYPYSLRCRSAFKDIHGIDPLDLGEEVAAHNAWRQFRYDAVTNVVNNFAVPAAKKYNKKITAAVFPNWESVRQQWQQWDIDGFLPMLYHGFYNEDIHWIADQVAKNKALLKSDKPIYAGLFLGHLKPEDIETIYNEVMEKEGSGLALFAYGGLNQEFKDIMKKVLLS